MNRNTFHDTVNEVIRYGIDKQILHLHTSAQPIRGTVIPIHNRPVINFGSCSYLGLEFHPQLAAAAQQAIQDYGTQFSASRAYVSLGLYEQLQALLQQVFEAPVVIAPTTSLGHIACIPVVVEDDAAVIMDQQLHNSVQTAVQLVKARAVHTELVRHNRMDLLEEKIKELRHQYKTIWYMADGIYSMFGDGCPLDAIYRLLETYPELHCYLDDAHGIGVHGRFGRGYVLARHKIHPRMIVAASLNKAVAAGGGALVFGNAALAEKVNNTGGPLLSSGPMQPASLGAAIAAARILLGPELPTLQQQLHTSIQYTRLLLEKYKVPVVSAPGAAIFFVPVSLPKLGHLLVQQLLQAGFYVNLGIFPTVPMKQTGIRFTVTLLHSPAQLEQLIATLASLLPAAMQQVQLSTAEICRAFKLPVPGTVKNPPAMTDLLRQASLLQVQHSHSITGVHKETWDSLFRERGNFDWEGMLLLEKSFTGQALPQDNWRFDYCLVRDEQEQVIAATFFTTALWKDDMLSPAPLSAQLEKQRQQQPYHLCSTVVCSGSLFSEGEHVYLRRQSPLWQDALQLLQQQAYALQEQYGAAQVIFRDFTGSDTALDHLMLDNGFARVSLPDSYSVALPAGASIAGGLSANSRRQLQKKVLRYSPYFRVQVYSSPVPAALLQHWYGLYRQVQRRSLALNTFALPFALFEQLGAHPHWEWLVLQVQHPGHADDGATAAVVCCHRGSSTYRPMLIGLEDALNRRYQVYRQALYQALLRAQQLGCPRVALGFAAGTEKQKMGARPTNCHAYLHNTDSFNAQAIASLSMLVKTGVPGSPPP